MTQLLTPTRLTRFLIPFWLFFVSFVYFAGKKNLKTETERERGFGMYKEDNCGYYVDKRMITGSLSRSVSVFKVSNYVGLTIIAALFCVIFFQTLRANIVSPSLFNAQCLTPKYHPLFAF